MWKGAGSFGGANAEEGRKMLDELGLKASGAHISLQRFNDDFEGAIAEAKVFGCPYVIVPWVDKEVYQAGWDVFARQLEEIGRKVNAEGLTLCYHNHAFEFEGNGFDTLYNTASPELLKAQLDIAWCQIGGADPAKKIAELRERLPLVHLKDFDPDKQPQWTAAGQGKVDWDACLAEINKGDVEFGAIELDESPGDPFDSVAESVAFFRARGVSE